MKLYLAPMEGITSDAYRRALNANFPGIDRFFTAFISATHNLNYKQERDVNPANNVGIPLVPQFMAHTVESVLEMQQLLNERYGYSEINLNQGCPSGTVVSKNHGSGFLRDIKVMDEYFAELFEKATFPISLKTRIGVEDESEWGAILDVYKKYPFSEVIIHPRTTRDQYAGHPRLEAFERAMEELSVPICYNGDINTLEDYIRIKERFPNLECMMIGRGILRNPMLLNAIRQYEKTGKAEYQPNHEDWMQLKAMMKEIRDTYQATFSGDAHALAHLKELWGYLAVSFPDAKKEIKSLKKSRNLADFDAAVQLLFINK